MKKAILAFFCLVTVFFACKTTDPAPTVTADAYMSTSAGSKWTYDVITNPGVAGSTTVIDTVTSTATDTSISLSGSARIYHILKHTSGNTSDYFLRSGNDYYRYQNVPVGSTKIENIYLKDNVAAGVSWSQTVTVVVGGVPLPVTITNSINAKSITKTVNGVTYTDVIDVKTDITSSALPAGSITSDIHSYYARKVGLIQGDYKVLVPLAAININTQTLLKTAVIL
jgi:hypothetical protein